MGANVQQLYENDEKLGNILFYLIKSAENNFSKTWQSFFKKMKSFSEKLFIFCSIRLDESVNSPWRIGNWSWRIRKLFLTGGPACQAEFFLCELFATFLYIQGSLCFNPSPPSPCLLFLAIICAYIVVRFYHPFPSFLSSVSFIFVIQSVAKDLVNIKRRGCYRDFSDWVLNNSSSSLRSSGWK